jgi:hypothetical protein
VSIESEEIILTYDRSLAMIEPGVLFTLTDKVTGESSPIGFSLKYWSGYQELEGQPSGVYIFRPAPG